MMAGVAERGSTITGSHRTRRRVLFFDAYPHLYAGGQRAMHLMMTGLRARGWSVELATPAEGPFPDVARSDGFPVHIVVTPLALLIYGRQTTGRKAASAAVRLPLLWLSVARWMRGRFDVVHIADHRGLLLAGVPTRLAGIPVVWHIHGIDRTSLLNRGGSALANGIVVPSRAMADDMPGLREAAVAIAPYALPPEAFVVERREPKAPTLLTLARLHPDKGLDILLRAISVVRASIPGLQAIIAGPSQEGFADHERFLYQLCHELALDDVVEFIGPVDRAQPLLTNATLFVLASREKTELQPIVLLEAMAAGVPVVATTVGGVAEMLDHGQRGRLVRPDDPDGLAKAIVDALLDSRGARARAAYAQTWANENCKVDRLVDQIEAVYRSL